MCTLLAFVFGRTENTVFAALCCSKGSSRVWRGFAIWNTRSNNGRAQERRVCVLSERAKGGGGKGKKGREKGEGGRGKGKKGGERRKGRGKGGEREREGGRGKGGERRETGREEEREKKREKRGRAGRKRAERERERGRGKVSIFGKYEDKNSFR